MCDGLDYLGCDDMDPHYLTRQQLLGFDWMSLAKGAAGALSGTGDLLGPGDKKKGGDDDVKKALEKQKLEDEKKRAEASATTMKIVLGVVAVLGAATEVALVVRRK